MSFTTRLDYLKRYWIPNKLSELKLTDAVIAAAAFASFIVALGQYEVNFRTLEALSTSNTVAKEQSLVSMGQLRLALAQAEDAAEMDTDHHPNAEFDVA